jgi:hypothetical protein
MNATFYYERLAAFRQRLMERGYDLRQAYAAVTTSPAPPVLVQLPDAVLGNQVVVAIPDVHLSDGKGGDIFVDGDPGNPKRFLATLRALRSFVRSDPSRVTPIQLGDWYDVWRSYGRDTTDSRYSSIDDAPAFQEILALDKQLGLAHVIGNHDASFTHALPDRRVGDGARFRFGFGLAGSHGRVFALHGHQADRIEGEPNSDFDQLAVWLGTLAATYAGSQFRSLQELIDKRGTDGALVWLGSMAAQTAASQLPGGLGPIKAWLVDLLGKAREDVQPEPRELLASPANEPSLFAGFVKREAVARLARISVAATRKLYGPSVKDLQLLFVGHSHKACVSWTPHPTSGRPVVVVDAGSWAYGQAQLLFAAGNTVGVYDVVP